MTWGMFAESVGKVSPDERYLQCAAIFTKLLLLGKKIGQA